MKYNMVINIIPSISSGNKSILTSIMGDATGNLTDSGAYIKMKYQKICIYAL